MLREKLNDKEKSNLEFLKEALSHESNFNKVLSHDNSKIKNLILNIYKINLQS
ncbi:Mlp family lipoprotein [Borrelia miyamotoi]|uniref:Mlp family lipoprotein n=1 Tax=Borrelia miyamotoi TaxID=47466 RepID=UPI003977D963